MSRPADRRAKKKTPNQSGLMIMPAVQPPDASWWMNLNREDIAISDGGLRALPRPCQRGTCSATACLKSIASLGCVETSDDRQEACRLRHKASESVA